MGDFDDIGSFADQLLRQLRGQDPLTESEIEQARKDPEKRRLADLEFRRRKDEEWKAEQRRILLSRCARVLPPMVAWVMEREESASEAVSAARSWSASDRRGLLLRGGVGAGKSVAAAVAAREVALSSHGTISWHRPNDFVSAVLHAYDEKSPKLGESIVVIDDVGRETKADFCEAMCAFIDDKSTRFVITTNLKREDFRARYDDRLIDRLNDCARAVSVKSPSMRKKDGGF